MFESAMLSNFVMSVRHAEHANGPETPGRIVPFFQIGAGPRAPVTARPLEITPAAHHFVVLCLRLQG